jgi:hypothetical protein
MAPSSHHVIIGTSRACLVSPKDDEGSQMLLPPYYFNASSFELRLSTIPPFE